MPWRDDTTLPSRGLLMTAARQGKRASGVLWACVMTFDYRVDRWTDDGNSILDYVAAIADFAARAAYRAACRRWREIGQRARPPTEAALPRSLQPGTGLLTH